MKKTNSRFNLPFLLVAISPLLLAACGGGSGDSAPVVTPTPTPTSPPTPLPQKQEQTLTPFTVTAMKVGETSSVSATSSSGLEVSFTSDTPSTCTVTPAGIVTAVGYGTCTIAANQFGNDAYRQITTRSSVLVIGAQTISLSLPALTVGEVVPVVFSASSQLPVTLTSKTVDTCTVKNGVVTVQASAPAVCTITASQAGVENYYAAATSVTVTTNIGAANSILLDNAIKAPETFPEENSLALDSTISHEGFYTSPTDSAVIDKINNPTASAIIDKNNKITYFDNLGAMFGLLKFSPSSPSWILDDSSSYYNLTVDPMSVKPARGEGTLTAKTSLKTATATSLSFTTNPSPLDLSYSVDNGFALDKVNVAGTWYADDGTSSTQITVNAEGVLAGTLVTLKSSGLPSRCLLTGSLVSSEANTKHNMFDLAIMGSSDTGSGTTCDLDSNTYQGNAIVRFFPVTSNDANGLAPNLVAVIRTTNSKLRIVSLFKAPK